MKHSELDIRMKENYENRSKNFLTRRIPVIIRVDGKSFHTFCKRFKKPYDEVLNESLNRVMENICEHVQGVKFAERHSDELSFLLTDYDTITTDAFFDYNVQKICSVVASKATAEFCRRLMLSEQERMRNYSRSVVTHEQLLERTVFQQTYNKVYLDSNENWPTFDCRCFNIPKEEITNYFWWRMLDSKRGSINMMAQSLFSHKDLQNLSCDEMQEKMWKEKNMNWAKLPQGQKIGFCCRKVVETRPIPAGPKKGEMVVRSVWNTTPSPENRTDLDELITLQLRSENEIPET
jgi:tRNA(His) 5'-end guanylyltransferase